MSKPSFVDLDFLKSWRSILLLLGLLPVTFAIQSYLIYLTLPTFFGTTFKPGFTWEPVLLTTFIWAGSTVFVSLSMPISMLRRGVMRRLLSPEAGDRMVLKRKQKEQQQTLNLLMMQPGRQKNRAAVISFLKTIPFNLLKTCVVLYVASQAMPSLFVNKSLSSIFAYAVCYVAFDVSTNCLKTMTCFRDIRRAPSATISDTTENPAHKSSVFGQALSEIQEERAIEVTRTDLAIGFEGSASNYLARGKATRGSRENILALEDFDKALALDPQSIEAYKERAQTYLALELKALAKSDLAKAAQLCAAGDRLSERDKIFEELRDLNAKSSPHRPKGLTEAMAVISPLFTANISPLQEKGLKDVQVDLQGHSLTAPVYCRQAELLFQKGLFEEASQACDKAIELQPSIGQAYRLKGKLAMAHHNDAPTALTNLDRAISLDSKDSEAWEERARLKLQLGQYQSALEDCREAMVFSKSNQFKILRAMALLGLGKTDEALNDLNQYVTSSERAIVIWNSLRLPLCRRVADELSEVLIHALELRALVHEQVRNVDKAASDAIAVQKLRERKRPPALKSKQMTEVKEKNE